MFSGQSSRWKLKWWLLWRGCLDCRRGVLLWFVSLDLALILEKVVVVEAFAIGNRPLVVSQGLALWLFAFFLFISFSSFHQDALRFLLLSIPLQNLNVLLFWLLSEYRRLVVFFFTVFVQGLPRLVHIIAQIAIECTLSLFQHRCWCFYLKLFWSCWWRR